VPFSVDEEADEVDELEDAELDDELESDGSASATPGMVAIAVPTPSATANAPTRPIYLACPIFGLPSCPALTWRKLTPS